MDKQEKAERLRRFIAVISVIFTIYYLYWRLGTFNSSARVFSWALYSAEFFGAVTTFLFYFMVWRPRARTSLPPLLNKKVDVLVPTMKEPIPVLRKTLIACGDMKYPHRTLVLDDGSRQEVKALCEELGCVYLARESHEHAKAGNLNFGLEHSDAEFVAVFDADHAPLPDFLDKLIGYFVDERVGFVQIPQEFYNIDSFQHRVDEKKKYIWGEQYLFFSLLQPGKDHWNAAYFVGSCAILRRKTLDDIGGFATDSITEDMLTSIRIHTKGWRSVYHNENLAYGIAAETLLPFHIQRQRWGVGNWQIFFKANPLFVRGLSFPQRLSYLASMIYPLEGFQKIIFYSTPVIALITGVLPMRALNVDYLLHFIPYFAVTQFGFSEVARGYGGIVMLEQFSMGKFFTYIKSVLSFFLPRMRKTFKVTPKGERSHTPYGLILPQIIVFLGSLFAISWALFGLLTFKRNDNFIVAVNCFWALFNSSLALAIIQYDYKKLVQRREIFRIPDLIPISFRIKGHESGKKLTVADNLTEKGLSMIAVGQIGMGEELEMELLLPSQSLELKGAVMQEKSVSSENGPVSRIGVKFTGMTSDVSRILTRYLHGTAVPKFMKEYSTRSKTYLEKRFGLSRGEVERAYRNLAYLPVNVSIEQQEPFFAVIKDISKTGLLLSSRALLPSGTLLNIQALLGNRMIQLEGIVVRNLTRGYDEFPEYLAGVKLRDPSV